MQKISTISGISYLNINNLDIIPGKYEGGQTLWDCTVDFLHHQQEWDVKGKTVIDMGCGLGLLGIQALKAGASKVVFQDFNSETYDLALRPQLQLNFESTNDLPIAFVSGDWDDIQTEPVDLILAAEVVYREECYHKVENFIARHLKPDGVARMLNKSYYFGVGGSVQGFAQSLTKLRVTQETIINPKNGVKKVLQTLRLMSFKDNVTQQ